MASKSESKCVLQFMSNLHLNAELADVTFVFKTDDDVQKVPAHKCILASASPVFNKMFFGPMKEKDAVHIVDSRADAFREFLQFFYLDDVVLTMENMEEVCQLADKYDMINALKSYATSVIGKLTIDKMCWGYQLAIIAENDKLRAYCEKHIAAFPHDIFKSDTFHHCAQDVLKRILELDPFLCQESDIFNACLSWAKFYRKQEGLDENDSHALRKELGDCFFSIRFGAMTHDEFIEHTVAYEKLFTRNELAHILYKSTAAFTPNKFNQNPRSKSLFEWDSNNNLVCSRENPNVKSEAAIYIQSPESVWFSTSFPLVLGELDCTPVQNTSGFTVQTNFIIKIIEINAQSFEVSAPTKIIFDGAVTITGAEPKKVTLDQPLPLNPNKMYEIRFEAATNTSTLYNYNLPWNQKEKLDDKSTIEFHNNPANSDRRGLVSRLYFNTF